MSFFIHFHSSHIVFLGGFESSRIKGYLAREAFCHMGEYSLGLLNEF
jgi:hypothetical protein